MISSYFVKLEEIRHVAQCRVLKVSTLLSSLSLASYTLGQSAVGVAGLGAFTMPGPATDEKGRKRDSPAAEFPRAVDCDKVTGTDFCNLCGLWSQVSSDGTVHRKLQTLLQVQR